MAFNEGVVDYVLSKYRVPDEYSTYNRHTYTVSSFHIKNKYMEKDDPINIILLFAQYQTRM